MAAANRWLAGTPLEDWRRRNVDVLADRLMDETAQLFDERLNAVRNNQRDQPLTAPRVSRL